MKDNLIFVLGVIIAFVVPILMYFSISAVFWGVWEKYGQIGFSYFSLGTFALGFFCFCLFLSYVFSEKKARSNSGMIDCEVYEK